MCEISHTPMCRNAAIQLLSGFFNLPGNVNFACLFIYLFIYSFIHNHALFIYLLFNHIPSFKCVLWS